MMNTLTVSDIKQILRCIDEALLELGPMMPGACPDSTKRAIAKGSLQFVREVLIEKSVSPVAVETVAPGIDRRIAP